MFTSNSRKSNTPKTQRKSFSTTANTRKKKIGNLASGKQAEKRREFFSGFKRPSSPRIQFIKINFVGRFHILVEGRGIRGLAWSDYVGKLDHL